MVLAEDLCTSDGLRVVLPKGEKITDALTEKLTNFSNQQEVAATVEVESTETNTPALAISPV